MATTKAPKVNRKDETARERFVRLANARGNRALSSIELLGNLASGNYEYGAEDVDKLFAVIRDAVDRTEAKFRQPTTKGKREPVTIV